MPNVMGREFPYTAEGMAAAQQYSQAMGMRDGGSMGFRPIGYAGGGVATPQPGGGTSMTGFMGTSSPLAQLFRDRYVAPSGNALPLMPRATPVQPQGEMVLNDFRREFGRDPSGPPELQEYMLSRGLGYAGGGPVGYADGDVVNANRQVYSDFQRALTELPMNELAGYIYDNLSNLKSMVEENPARAAQLNDAMEKSGFEGYVRNLMKGSQQSSPSEFLGAPADVSNLDRMGSAFGDSRISNYDMAGNSGFLSPDDPALFDPPMEGLEPPMETLEGMEDMEGMEGLPPMPYYNPNQLNPFFNPNEIEVADGGYITRKMNRGGIMSLRGY